MTTSRHDSDMPRPPRTPWHHHLIAFLVGCLLAWALYKALHSQAARNFAAPWQAGRIQGQ